MHKHFRFLLVALAYAISLNAQVGKASKEPVRYTTFMQLQPGEKAVPFYSCMWLNEKNQFRTLVIQHEGNKYSVITEQGRKDNLSMQEVLGYTTNSACSKYDPHRPPTATKYSGSKLTRVSPKGKYTIKSRNNLYGPFEEILFIQENGEKFIAVAKALVNGKDEMIYIDSEGKKKTLPGRPFEFVVNTELTKAAIIMPPVEALPTEVVNKWPAEKRDAYYDSLSKKKEVVWFNNDSIATLTRQYRRLEYDVTGRHFIAVYTDHFDIDGKAIKKNISGAGTRLFVGKNPADWVYWYEIYLGFSDGVAYQNVNCPFFTVDNGREFLNWFVVEPNKNGDIIKLAKKEL